jgi:chorismate mutase
VVFVADSQPSMLESNRESFANLIENMEQNNIDPNDTPIVIQYNKRDIPGVLPVEQLQEQLGFEGFPYAEASAIKGEGVMETFKLISKITAKHLFTKLKAGSKSEGPVKKAPPLGVPKVAVKAKPKAAPEPAPEPERIAEPAMLDNEPLAEAPNPFADSVPFADSAPVEADYDGAEEVSLEQLLAEGRTRPATISGNIPVPVDEIEELGAEELLPMDESPVAVAVMDEEPAPQPVVYADTRVAELEKQIDSLQQKLRIKQSALEAILRELDELRARVSEELQG